MERQRPTELIMMRPATVADVNQVNAIIEEYGEDNVDRRTPEALEASIACRSLHVFINRTGQIIGTGGAYPYEKGLPFVEVGTSCWLPTYRGGSGADVSLITRSVLAALNEPGVAIVSELYEESIKSERVLQRCGLEQVAEPPDCMIQHALLACTVRPVRHFALPPVCFPEFASRLLRWIDGIPTQGRLQRFRFAFHPAYRFNRPSMREVLKTLAAGDLSVIGASDYLAAMPVSQYLRNISSASFSSGK